MSKYVASSPHFFRPVKRAILAALAALLVLAALFPAPLEVAADPSHPPNPAKSAWFLLWIQELVSWSTLAIYAALAADGPLGRGSAGPNLSGVFSAHYPATAPGSRSWTGETLGKWLENPRSVRTRSAMRSVRLEAGQAPTWAGPSPAQSGHPRRRDVRTGADTGPAKGWILTGFPGRTFSLIPPGCRGGALLRSAPGAVFERSGAAATRRSA